MMLSPSSLLVTLLHARVDIFLSSGHEFNNSCPGRFGNFVQVLSALNSLSAGYDRRLKLLGVSTVAGNQTVEKVTLNALGVLTAAGLRDIRESRGIRLCLLAD